MEKESEFIKNLAYWLEFVPSYIRFLEQGKCIDSAERVGVMSVTNFLTPKGQKVKRHKISDLTNNVAIFVKKIVFVVPKYFNKRLDIRHFNDYFWRVN